MKIKTKVLVIGLGMVFPTMVMAGTPGAGLLGTDHDFASASSGFLGTQNVISKSGATANATANTVGLCSYCHTPHSAISTSLLWNHKLSANTFTWDDAKTTGGTNYASLTPTYKGPTVKCLSCHDGTVAIGDVSIYKQRLNSSSQWNTAMVSGVKQIATVSGSMAGNHPVGMPYPFGQAANTYNSISTGGDVLLTEFVADPTASSAAKIKLYNDNGSGTISSGTNAGATGLECSSCHDPHNKSTVDDLFLRGKIAGSTVADGYICVQCHVK
jgi:hypothetical protein